MCRVYIKPTYTENGKFYINGNSSNKGKRFNLHAGGDEVFDFIQDITQFLYGKALSSFDMEVHLGNIYKAFSQSELYIRHTHLIEANPIAYEDLVNSVQKQRRGRYLH